MPIRPVAWPDVTGGAVRPGTAVAEGVVLAEDIVLAEGEPSAGPPEGGPGVAPTASVPTRVAAVTMECMVSA